MRLTRQRLNRTLLRRQHLLERVATTPEEMTRHLVGLQAQETLPPYLSLHARLTSFDPYAVSWALEQRELVRLMAMRDTIHLLTVADALELRAWTQAVMDRQPRSGKPSDARLDAPLVQCQPRGTWKGGASVVYEHVEAWTGRPVVGQPDVPGIVRRYLAAFGPASAADVTAWSGLTRLGPVLAGMDDLDRHEDEAGKVLYDVPGGVVEDEDAPAPVRLLGTYDNVWLSHAGRDRVTEPEKRKRWMGANGGVGMALFADGRLEGLWRPVDGRVEIVDMFRSLTRRERSELDEEVGRVEELLGR